MENRNPLISAMIAGGLAGTTVDLVLFPLDTIKTRLVSITNKQSKVGFWKSGGFRNIYSGLSSVVVGSSPSAALFFVTYESSKSVLGDNAMSHMFAASFGEIAACSVRVPTEVIKQRMQVGHYSKIRNVASDVVRNEGWKGFYRGFGMTVFREIPFACVQFPVYESLRFTWSRRKGSQTNSLEAGVCGMIAGGIAAAVTTPLDVMKTRIMTSPVSKKTAGLGTTIIFAYNEIAAQGYSRFLSGIGPRMLWISIGGMIFLGAYDATRKTILQPGRMIQ